MSRILHVSPCIINQYLQINQLYLCSSLPVSASLCLKDTKVFIFVMSAAISSTDVIQNFQLTCQASNLGIQIV